MLDCSSEDDSTKNHTKAITAANMTATAPADQNYTMGDSAITVGFKQFIIGLC